MHLKLLPKREVLEYQRTVEKWHKISRLGNLQGKTCLDLGAHVGIVSLNIASITGCFVQAYEPHPGNYKDLVYHVIVNNLQKLIYLKLDEVYLRMGAIAWVGLNMGGYALLLRRRMLGFRAKGKARSAKR